MSKRNIIDFSSNIFEPKQVLYNNNQYTLYLARFKGLHDLYNYLKSDPKINKKFLENLLVLLVKKILLVNHIRKRLKI